MRFLRPVTIGALLALAQLSAFGAEVAVLRNGRTVSFERKEEIGSITRLYTGTGYLDIASDQIASFETEEAPVAAPSAAAPVVSELAASSPAAVPVAATTTPSAPVQTAPPAQAASRVDLDQLIREASTRNRIDPDFVASVIKAESNFKTHAVSKKGAQGLMQLMPGTAAQLGVADPFDPRANVEAGTAHLNALLSQYHDDPIKALAAYNAGAHRVKQYNGVPPYRETRAYISQIVRDFNAKKRSQMKTAVAAGASATAKPKTKPAKASTQKPQTKTKPQQATIAKPVSPA